MARRPPTRCTGPRKATSTNASASLRRDAGSTRVAGLTCSAAPTRGLAHHLATPTSGPPPGCRVGGGAKQWRRALPKTSSGVAGPSPTRTGARAPSVATARAPADSVRAARRGGERGRGGGGEAAAEEGE
ncbi:unnamed protein product [Prorocentrum cordatum]|uniref:Uncharacterized protein n=1 Tax=Prorocentrum cordatum TaxID=2364126 RepID=A0ABN9X0T8_9DINO|nr:unnamed protein product [Polarella glacialis]